jgi:AraC-like DNA-binding protein
MDSTQPINPSDLQASYEDNISSASLLAAPYPFVIGTYDALAPGSDLHWHDSIEIGYVVAGSGVFVIEHELFSFAPGQVHVINSTDRHMAFSAEPAQFFNIHFHPGLLRDATFPTLDSATQRLFALHGQRFRPMLPADHPHTSRIVEVLRRIADEHQAARPYWELAVKGLLLQIISQLLRHFLEPDALDPAIAQRQALLQRLLPALQQIEQSLDEPPRIADLASVVALSPSRFTALFRAATGTSPVAYRNSRRIERARRLLLTESIPSSQVAEACGFHTVQQFNRLFRRAVGCTPSAYRQRLQQSPTSAESTGA